MTPPLLGSFLAFLTTTDLPRIVPGHTLYGHFKAYTTSNNRPRPTNVNEVLALADAAGLRIETTRQGRKVTSRIHTERNS